MHFVGQHHQGPPMSNFDGSGKCVRYTFVASTGVRKHTDERIRIKVGKRRIQGEDEPTLVRPKSLASGVGRALDSFRESRELVSAIILGTFHSTCVRHRQKA